MKPGPLLGIAADDTLERTGVCLGYLVEVLGLDVGEWIDRWRAEISPGETLLDPRYGRRGSYHSGWNLRLNVDEEQLLEWRRH